PWGAVARHVRAEQARATGARPDRAARRARRRRQLPILGPRPALPPRHAGAGRPRLGRVLRHRAARRALRPGGAGAAAVHPRPPAGQVRASSPRLSLGLTLALLGVSAAASAFVSDWFINGLAPAIHQLNISQAFAGLVIVAIAGNAVENATGLVLAWKRRSNL